MRRRNRRQKKNINRTKAPKQIQGRTSFVIPNPVECFQSSPPPQPNPFPASTPWRPCNLDFRGGRETGWGTFPTLRRFRDSWANSHSTARRRGNARSTFRKHALKGRDGSPPRTLIAET